MENPELVFQILTAIGTIIGTAIMFVLRDVRDGKHPFKKNGTAESVKVLRDMRGTMSQLQAHYNDETTELLREISETGRKTLAKLEEFDKYGLPLRK